MCRTALLFTPGVHLLGPCKVGRWQQGPLVKGTISDFVLLLDELPPTAVSPICPFKEAAAEKTFHDIQLNRGGASLLIFR